MPVLYNKVKSLTIRVSKFLVFSNFLICIYCFYYKFIKPKEKRAMLTFNLKTMDST